MSNWRKSFFSGVWPLENVSHISSRSLRCDDLKQRFSIFLERDSRQPTLPHDILLYMY